VHSTVFRPLSKRPGYLAYLAARRAQAWAGNKVIGSHERIDSCHEHNLGCVCCVEYRNIRRKKQRRKSKRKSGPKLLMETWKVIPREEKPNVSLRDCRKYGISYDALHRSIKTKSFDLNLKHLCFRSILLLNVEDRYSHIPSGRQNLSALARILAFALKKRASSPSPLRRLGHWPSQWEASQRKDPLIEGKNPQDNLEFSFEEFEQMYSDINRSGFNHYDDNDDLDYQDNYSDEY